MQLLSLLKRASNAVLEKWPLVLAGLGASVVVGYFWLSNSLVAELAQFGVTDLNEVQARYIPSGSSSMAPTLIGNDRLAIKKVHLPFALRRGQIVLFMPPPQAHSNQAFIKRVIGVAGDTIEIKNGKVFLNGTPQNESYVSEAVGYTMPLVHVPQKNYFVLGDGRNNSADSHVWGFLPEENVIGYAIIRFWPLDRFREFEPHVKPKS